VPDCSAGGLFATSPPVGASPIAPDPGTGAPRALPAAEVAAAARSLGLAAMVAPTVPAAVSAALERATVDDLVLVTGSIYVAGAARTALEGGVEALRGDG